MDLKKWSEDVYVRPMQELHESISEVDRGEKTPSKKKMVSIPGLPLQIPSKFMHFFYREYMQKLTGARDNTLEICLDLETSGVIHALFISHPTGILARCETIELKPGEGDFSAIAKKIKEGTPRDDIDLNPLFSGIKKSLEGRTGAAIDRLTIITGKYLEQLHEINETATVKKGSLNLRGLLSYIKLQCDSRVRGWIIDHPRGDKISRFSSRITRVLPLGDAIMQDLIHMFIPAGPTCLVLLENNHALPFKLEKTGGNIILTSLEANGLYEYLPVKNHKFNAIAKAIKKTHGVKEVLFLSLPRIMDIFINLVDNIISGDYDGAPETFYQVLFELFFLFAKDFRVSWYSSPRPPLARLLNRLSLRLIGLRADIPRIWHDNGAKKASRLMMDLIEGNDLLLLGILKDNKAQQGIEIYKIAIRNSIVRSVEPVNGNALKIDLASNTTANGIAKQIHDRFTQDGGNNVRVVVLSRSTIKLASELFKQALSGNFFHVIKTFKLVNHVRREKNLGVFPPVPSIDPLLKQNSFKILKRIKKALFLKY